MRHRGRAVLGVGHGRMLVRSRVSNCDVVSSLSEQPDRNGAEKPRPSDEGNAHPGMLVSLRPGVAQR
jgi:hypothetical protein